MNLIEKLGGYEKAKEKAKEIEHDINNLDFSCGGSPMESMYERLESIENALLEYRRENNIFECGDAIIRRWNDRVYWIITDIDNGSEFMISENRNAKFKDCKVCDMPCNFTFATPEEIKAGHRL